MIKKKTLEVASCTFELWVTFSYVIQAGADVDRLPGTENTMNLVLFLQNTR